MIKMVLYTSLIIGQHIDSQLCFQYMCTHGAERDAEKGIECAQCEKKTGHDRLHSWLCFDGPDNTSMNSAMCQYYLHTISGTHLSIMAQDVSLRSIGDTIATRQHRLRVEMR